MRKSANLPGMSLILDLWPVWSVARPLLVDFCVAGVLLSHLRYLLGHCLVIPSTLGFLRGQKFPENNGTHRFLFSIFLYGVSVLRMMIQSKR